MSCHECAWFLILFAWIMRGGCVWRSNACYSWPHWPPVGTRLSPPAIPACTSCVTVARGNQNCRVTTFIKSHMKGVMLLSLYSGACQRCFSSYTDIILVVQCHLGKLGWTRWSFIWCACTMYMLQYYVVASAFTSKRHKSASTENLITIYFSNVALIAWWLYFFVASRFHIMWPIAATSMVTCAERMLYNGW